MKQLFIILKNMDSGVSSAFDSKGPHLVIAKAKNNRGPGDMYLTKRDRVRLSKYGHPLSGAYIGVYEECLRKESISYSIVHQFPELNPSLASAERAFMHYWWVETKDVEEELHVGENADFLSLLTNEN